MFIGEWISLYILIVSTLKNRCILIIALLLKLTQKVDQNFGLASAQEEGNEHHFRLGVCAFPLAAWALWQPCGDRASVAVQSGGQQLFSAPLESLVTGCGNSGRWHREWQGRKWMLHIDKNNSSDSLSHQCGDRSLSCLLSLKLPFSYHHPLESLQSPAVIPFVRMCFPYYLRYLSTQALTIFPWHYSCTYLSVSPDMDTLDMRSVPKWLMNTWKTSHTADALWWARGTEHTKSHSFLTVDNTSCITTSPTYFCAIF